MKKVIVNLKSAFGVIFALLVAGQPAYAQKLSELPKVATKVSKGGEELVVCSYPLLKKTYQIPLSALTEELKIIKLDGDDRALVQEGSVIISDNFILVKGAKQNPYKLFDKKTGKFITNIGAYGRGPGEYMNVYDQQLDEKNNRIYLLPWQSNKILVYDLKGTILAPIPLYLPVPKGCFKVTEEKVAITLLPFEGMPAVAYTQTLKGELIGSVKPGALTIPRDFSNEVFASKNQAAFSFNVFTFAPRKDTLYHFDVNQIKLIPRFTIDFKGLDELPIHTYVELPLHYMGDFSEPKKKTENVTVTQNHRFYVVDKETQQGGFFELSNDFLGNLPIGWPTYCFKNGYFVQNMEPNNLKDVLTKALEDKKISEADRKKLTNLKNSITDNDNNYILYAPLKK